MSEEVLIKVENVSKKFCRDLKRSLWYGVKDIVTELIGSSADEDSLRRDEFWAVKDVSFELKRGECLGLIGHNGAGKSTLLKMLNGIIKPDKGRISMHGRVGALIELGAGFNPILTGRENLYINGQILGFTKKEVDRKFESIVEFAEIKDFIDMPVQNYSSGMKVRLGFAVAAQMEPDILIIDEVLAVGDIGFQVKCFNKINDIIEKSAVVFVSHSMPNIGRLASRTILMKSGKVSIDSTHTREAIEAYYAGFKTEEKKIVSSVLQFEKVQFCHNSRVINFGDDFAFKLKFNSAIEITDAQAGLSVVDQSLRIVGVFRSEIGKIKKGRNTINFNFRNLRFAGNVYYFSIEINRFQNGLKREVYGVFKNIETFTMTSHPFEADSVVFLEGEMNPDD